MTQMTQMKSHAMGDAVVDADSFASICAICVICGPLCFASNLRQTAGSATTGSHIHAAVR